MGMDINSIGEWIAAASGLGLAAFAIVEGSKWTGIGLYGFPRIQGLLGPLFAMLKVAYGPEVVQLLKALYRQDRTGGDLERTLRQGVRVGLTAENAERAAKFVGVGEGAPLKQVAVKVREGEELADDERNLLARFELAVDSRIEAALSLADSHYSGKVRMTAAVISLTIALAVAFTLDVQDGALDEEQLYGWATLLGLLGVPLAPIAKDVVNALQAAEKALRRRA